MSLSVGVEIEGVALRRAQSSAPFPIACERQLQIIADAMNEAGNDARIYIPSTIRGTGPDYTIWNVTLDATVSEITSNSDAEDSEFKTRFGFELVSPVFYNTNERQWQRDLRRGIEPIQTAIKWKANRSTGLHVHIGRGATGRMYTLDEVKKIAIFYCRFESAIDEFHPLHRSQDNENIMSNRKNELLDSLSVEEIYNTIRSANNIVDVCKITNYCSDGIIYDGYSDSRFFKVNFTSLQKHDTIEFRQHEGTTDPREMILWIRFLLKFVNFALEAPFESVTAPGEDFEDLVQLIGPSVSGNF
ncbi:putative amidoligase [Xylariales sp. AK1849]|nr:putative amidoligase [Xylariales sp. AK1849]